jgi:hypothetical protein
MPDFKSPTFSCNWFYFATDSGTLVLLIVSVVPVSQISSTLGKITVTVAPTAVAKFESKAKTAIIVTIIETRFKIPLTVV